MTINSNALNLPETLDFKAFDCKRNAYVDNFEILINVTPGEGTTIKVIPNGEEYFGDECMQQGWVDKNHRFIIDVFEKRSTMEIEHVRLYEKMERNSNYHATHNLTGNQYVRYNRNNTINDKD
ncbi:hypothetical protein MA9V2_042 [Chryseobacterium phage MA9V-2]|nr:hypothetical protein MA9V2_042 [Chryseobacterium phage MA9V-2]